MMIFKDIKLDRQCSENLDVKLIRKWKDILFEKFSQLIDELPDTKDVFFVGSLFGSERIMEKCIDRFFETLKTRTTLRFTAILCENEYKLLMYRKDIPENLRIIKEGSSECRPTAKDDRKEGLFIIKQNTVFFLNERISIERTGGELFLNGLPEGKIKLIPFEASGYEDADEKHGYSIFDPESLSFKEVVQNKFVYETKEVKITVEDTRESIDRKINRIIQDYKYETFLRINLTGKAKFGFMPDTAAIAETIKRRLFYAEVYDNTVMYIDEADFENDISLKSEFVRLALQDDTLSTAERNRIISCGWNVLCGRSVNEE